MVPDWKLAVSQGGTVRRTLTFRNTVDGTLVDTTGWVWRARVSGQGVDIAASATQLSMGVVELLITSGQTSILVPAVYKVAVDWTDAGGNTPEQEVAGLMVVDRQVAP